MSAKTAPPPQPLALTNQYKDAISLVDRVHAITTIANKQEYDKADADYRELIQKEKILDIQYAELECVQQAKIAQTQKAELAAKLKAAKQYIKNSPMKAFDDEQERIRLAKEEAERKILQEAQDKENARLKKIADAAKAVADKEAKRLAEIAAKAKGKADKEKAAADLLAAKKRQDEAAAEQARVKEEAASAPDVTVVVEKSHQGVARREIFRWRLTTKTGAQYVKGAMKASDRLIAASIDGLPAHLFTLDPVLLNEFVDSQGKAAAIPGVLEVKSEMV